LGEGKIHEKMYIELVGRKMLLYASNQYIREEDPQCQATPLRLFIFIQTFTKILLSGHNDKQQMF
jgi:hypothetical protein